MKQQTSAAENITEGKQASELKINIDS